jgi:heme-degrading monooxygenase HmoA
VARENAPENAANSGEKSALNITRYDAQTFARLQTGYAMYTSTFIFATRQLDERFYRLDETIATAAKAIPGYLGEEAWENASTGLTSNVYYWASLDALQALMQHPAHLEAKAAQANWLDGYQVIISEVLRTYGDAGFAHPAAAHQAQDAPPARAT